METDQTPEVNGATLRAIRRLNGYGLKELSAASGVSQSYICEIEKGRDVKVRPPTIKKLADALSVPVAALLRGSSASVDEVA